MMKKLFFIFMLAIFMIGTVSASDDFENNLTVENDGNILELNSGEELSSQVEKFNGDTFTELAGNISEASEGTLIELQRDVKFRSDEESFIAIDKSISIDGKGHSIDADNNAHIFKVTGADVVLKNIKFINGLSFSDGSCLEWYGENGLVDNCTFMNSESCFGGAVYWGASGGTISNSKFVNNTADFGGAVALYESNIKIINSTFINNSAGTGGAIDVSGDGCEVSNSKFIENSASIGSGAIAWYGMEGILSNSAFIKNHAVMATGAVDCGEGLKISECLFDGNYADGYGSLAVFSENVNVDNSTFKNNRAISETGGAIYAESQGLKFTNLLFENNSAVIAGAIYWAGENVLFNNITLSNNSAKTASNIYINGENAELVDIESDDEDDLMYVGEDYEKPVIKKHVEISNNLVKYLNWAFLNITLSKNVDSDIVISINGQNRTAKSKDGKAQLNLTDLENGDYNVSIGINDENIISNDVNVSFNIYVIKTRLVVDDFVTYEFSKEKLPIYLFDGDGNPISNKKLVLTIGNKTYSGFIGKNGTGLRNINLESGNYNLMITYKGDDTYLKAQTNISLIVKPKVDITTQLNKNINNVSYSVFLSKKLNETLIISLNGENKTVKSTDGKLNISFDDLDYGNYTVKVYMDDMYYYNEISDNFTVNVKKSFISSSDIQVIAGDMSKIALTLKDGKNNPIIAKNIKFQLNNQTFENITDENGFAFVNVVLNESGKYPVSIIFEGDDLYLPASGLAVVDVKNRISASISLKKLYNDVTINILLSEKINSNANIFVNGKTYSVKVVNGKASLKLSNLKSGSFKVSFNLNDGGYDLDNNAPKRSFKVTANDVLLKESLKAKLTLSKVTVKKSAKKLVLTANLKINGKIAKYKKLKFKFNKKTYNAKTNKKGIAKVTIKKSVLNKLKVGKKIKYQAIYGKKTVSKTVKVKR